MCSRYRRTHCLQSAWCSCPQRGGGRNTGWPVDACCIPRHLDGGCRGCHLPDSPLTAAPLLHSMSRKNEEMTAVKSVNSDAALNGRRDKGPKCRGDKGPKCTLFFKVSLLMAPCENLCGFSKCPGPVLGLALTVAPIHPSPRSPIFPGS